MEADSYVNIGSLLGKTAVAGRRGLLRFENLASMA